MDSLSFIKEVIKNNLGEDFKISEIPISNYININNTDLKGKINNIAKYELNFNKEYLDFNSYIVCSSINDGTLFFIYELIEQLLNKIYGLPLTNELYDLYNNKIANNENILLKYEYGNIVFVEECSNKFKTTEKPFLTTKYSLYLPYKITIK